MFGIKTSFSCHVDFIVNQICREKGMAESASPGPAMTSQLLQAIQPRSWSNHRLDLAPSP